MKLQAAVDKLFSHKLFSNKYFLYAVVAASILTNYMRIVDRHYEVVGFFILVGIIMMNFSKNVAVVLTVCLLLTQIIMAGKSVQEGLENQKKTDNFDADLKKYMTPAQLKELSQAEAKLRNAKTSIANEKKKLSAADANITSATTAINNAEKEVADNEKAHKLTKTGFNNASPKDKITKQRGVEIAKRALNLSNQKLAAAKATLAKHKKHKSEIDPKIAKLINEKKEYHETIFNINKLARAVKAKAEADMIAKANAQAEAKKAASTSGNKNANKTQMRQEIKQAKAAERIAKAAVKSAGKSIRGPNPLKRKNRFALLSDTDDETEDENYGIDLLEPSNLTDITQGTTNLMTKQKDLFSVMNSMTPLIDNAKKMLSGLDLSKLRA